MTRPTSARRQRRVIAAALLVATVAAGILPVPGHAGRASPTGVAPDSAPAAMPDGTPVDPAVSSSGASAVVPELDQPAPDQGALAAATSDGEPSEVYEEWLAHAADRISFTPGGRVTVGFKPRSTDQWSVGGLAPTALPAGRETGKAMAASKQGSGSGAITGQAQGGTAAGGAAAPVDEPVSVPIGRAVPLSAVVAAPDPAVSAAAASGLRRQVFGFLPYWQLTGAATSLNYGVLTTIAYFSVGADASGNLLKRTGGGSLTTGWGGWTSSALTSVINAAHAHGTRVVLTVSMFAWTNTSAATQRALLSSPTARANLARQIAAAVRDRGADGVNLDAEPLVKGQEANFVALLRTLRSQLNAIRRGYQITYDITGAIGNYPLEASVGASAADAVFVMGYDYRSGSSVASGSIDPLSGPGYDLADTVREVTARIDPSRVILGVPWYGRAWSTATSSPRSRNVSGTKYGNSAAVPFENIPALVKKYGRRWDPVEQSPYLVYRRRNCTASFGCVTSWRQVWYDDAASLGRRYQLVNDYGLRGAGVWALGFDGAYQDMARALSTAFLVDHSAPQAGIELLPPQSPDEGFAVAWSASDVSTVRSYDVEASIDGGDWQPWLTKTRVTSNVWLGHDGHSYAFRVRATDARGNVGAWNVTLTDATTPTSLAAGGFGRVTRNGLAYRAGPSTSAAKLGSLPAGTLVALTSGPVSAGGCTWYEVTQPVREWSSVSFVERGVWIAVQSGSTASVVPYHAPNTTVVDAGISGFDFGGGGLTGADPAAVAGRTFSPNGDGSQDGLRIRWTATVALRRLTLNVLRLDGSLVGAVNVPVLTKGAHGFTWDGKAGGKRVPDGQYLLQLAGASGSRAYRAPSARPATPGQVSAYAVTVDTVAPVVKAASASSALISPNGDGIRETAAFALSATGATRWYAQVAAGPEAPVRTASGTGGSLKFTWNGRNDAGAPAPDGAYTATLAACDVAGNCATRSYPVRLDTTAPKVSLAALPTPLSPNGDGFADTAVLGWTAPEAASGTMSIWRGSTLMRRWTVSVATAETVAWNGRTASGALVGDGRYTLRVDVHDAAGNRSATSMPLTVDRAAGFLRWSGNFYPQDGDALSATSKLSWRLTRTATTTLVVYDASGRLVRTVWADRSLTAGSRSWTWNGELADGSYVPQGAYTASLTVTSPYATQTLSASVWVAAFAASVSPSRLVGGGVLTVRFTAVEALKAVPRVTFHQRGLAPRTIAATRLGDGSYVARFAVRAGAPGAATVRILAIDAAGQADASWYTAEVAR